jgi:hypothetical protein
MTRMSGLCEDRRRTHRARETLAVRGLALTTLRMKTAATSHGAATACCIFGRSTNRDTAQ